jgi:hypothetical protein
MRVPRKIRPEIHGYSPEAHLSAPFVIADVLAIQALARGDADASQQQRALKWFVEGAANIYGETYDAANQHNSSFMQGRRYAGMRVVAMYKVNTGELADVEATRRAREAEQSRQK